MAKTNAQRQREKRQRQREAGIPERKLPSPPAIDAAFERIQSVGDSRTGEKRSRRFYSTPQPYPMPISCLFSSCRDTNTRQAKTCRDNYSPPDSP
ncbi:hypothetical protein ACTVWX_09670 [Pseudomonas aeruginosa]